MHIGITRQFLLAIISSDFRHLHFYGEHVEKVFRKRLCYKTCFVTLAFHCYNPIKLQRCRLKILILFLLSNEVRKVKNYNKISALCSAAVNFSRINSFCQKKLIKSIGSTMLWYFQSEFLEMYCLISQI